MGGRSFHVKGLKTEKVQGPVSGARNLEAESIKSRVEGV